MPVCARASNERKHHLKAQTMTKTHAFTVSIAYDDDAQIDETDLVKLVNAAVLEAIPDLGTEAPVVDTVPAKIPRILVSVSGGVASIDAVDGVVDIALADYDNLDDAPTAQAVDEAFEFTRHAGDEREMIKQLEDGREAGMKNVIRAARA